MDKNPKYKTGEQQKRRNISTSDSVWNRAKEIGNGNISEGIRIAIKAYKS